MFCNTCTYLIIYKNKIVMGIISKSVQLEKVCNCNQTIYNAGLKSEKSDILTIVNIIRFLFQISPNSLLHEEMFFDHQRITPTCVCRIINFWFENSA